MTAHNHPGHVGAELNDSIVDEKVGIQSTHLDNVDTDRAVETTLTQSQQKKLM